jgi:hypothetical protein
MAVFDPSNETPGAAGPPQLAAPPRSEAVTTKTIGKLDQRRSCRARVKIPLFIYGNTLQGSPFLEETLTIDINAHGALIAMKTTVVPGQRLLLTNETNERTQECTVLAVRARQGQDVEDAVAVTFGAPAPGFWRKLEAQDHPRNISTQKTVHARSR